MIIINVSVRITITCVSIYTNDALELSKWQLGIVQLQKKHMVNVARYVNNFYKPISTPICFIILRNSILYVMDFEGQCWVIEDQGQSGKQPYKDIATDLNV